MDKRIAFNLRLGVGGIGVDYDPNTNIGKTSMSLFGVGKVEQVAGADEDATVNGVSSDTQRFPVVNKIIRLTPQSAQHWHMFIGDLEWSLFPPCSLRQFRLIHTEGKPVAYICWALVTQEVLDRCKEVGPRLRPSEWRCGDIPLVMDVVAPFGGSEAVMKQLQEREFVGKDVCVCGG